MMAALRESDEDPVLVAEALKYLRGRKGAQAREKREKARKAGVPIGGPVGAGPEERNQQQQQLVVMRVD